MLLSELKLVFRSIRKNKTYAAINISGLALGLAVCMLIVFWVRTELSYDQFHQNKDTVFRVIQEIDFSNKKATWAVTQGKLGPAMQTDFPEIEHSARVFELGRFWQPLCENGDRQFYEDAFFAVDQSFLDIFSFPLTSGIKARALENTRSIIISERIAKKYFAGANPLGKILRLDRKFDFEITGVLKDIPQNSSLQFDFLVPFEFGKELEFEIDIWKNSMLATFIQTQPHADFTSLNLKIREYLSDKPILENASRLALQPLGDMHLKSSFEFDRFGVGDYHYVIVFSLVAAFILLIACINYMNLTIAQYAKRTKNICVRKIIGANRFSISRQFFTEALVIALLASGLAVCAVVFIMQTFNALTLTSLTLDFSNISTILGFFAITMMCGLIAGSYPALFLSSLHPTKLFSNVSRNWKTASFQKTLVVVQFTISVVLIIATIIVFKQVEFMHGRKLGYNQNQIITLRMPDNFYKNYNAFKARLVQNSRILNVTATSDLPTRGFRFSNDRWTWEGQDPDEKVLMRGVYIDYDYFETFDIPMKQGRGFSTLFPSDTADAIIVNEAALAATGLTEPLGKRFGGTGYTPKIIGIAQDYHFQSLHSKIEPLVLMYFGVEGCQHVCIKLNSENITQSIAYIAKTWDEFSEAYPFEYRFLDDSIQRLYQQEAQIIDFLQYFTFVAIFISCLGLFGLSVFMTQNRTKEIGVRKILGANLSQVVFILSKDYLKWIVIANLVAWPIAWIQSGMWLENYAYRIDLTVWPFVFAGLSALAIALLTVSWQAVRAATANPVEALRYE